MNTNPSNTSKSQWTVSRPSLKDWQSMNTNPSDVPKIQCTVSRPSVMQFIVTIIFSAIWWGIIPLEAYLKEDGWRILKLAVPAIVVISVILTTYGILRKQPSAFSLWFTFAAIFGWFSLKSAWFILYTIGFIRHPSSLHAPLEAAAVWVFLIAAVVTVLAFVACWFVRPKVFSAYIMALAAVNSAAIFLVRDTMHPAAVIQILDTHNKPVEEAELRCVSYTPNVVTGMVTITTVGQWKSNGDGKIKIKYMERLSDVIGIIRKNGYREIRFKLEGMSREGRRLHSWVPDSQVSNGLFVPVTKRGVSFNLCLLKNDEVKLNPQ